MVFVRHATGDPIVFWIIDIGIEACLLVPSGSLSVAKRDPDC